MSRRARLLLEHWSREAMTPYRARAAASAYSRLDDQHFGAMNTGEIGCMLACTGCLDALDELPAGGARSGAHGADDPVGAYRPYVWAERDWLTAEQMAERDAFSDQLVAEILAEEAAARPVKMMTASPPWADHATPLRETAEEFASMARSMGYRATVRTPHRRGAA